jgi:hypothetical protein
MKAPYIIEGLSSLPRGWGHCGVAITLDGKVANAIWRHKWRRNESSPLFAEMKAELGSKHGRIEFVGDSWLIRLIMVEPIQCSCFGMGGDHVRRLEAKEDVKWTSHNIDTPEQAAKIVAIWLHWFNNVSCFQTGKRTIITAPFAMA